MRIKRLDISGFKSFVDPTTLVFEKPIVGVVGPNGCGKSNIVDAIRWIMGEQSIKNLRGHNREDLIFAGSESRSPVGMCEVTMTIDNHGQPVFERDGKSFNEIQVTRRLFRNGDSEFFMNKAPCRLKDITDLFLGTGAGPRAYSTVEQGQVAAIISGKPEDRRLIIEEAAGITRYHSRKREAERKMASTRQNLLRVGDIIAEVKRQLNSLHRQAQKAERFRKLKNELKEIDLAFKAHEWQDVNARIEALKLNLASGREKEEATVNRLAALETREEAVSLRVREKEEALAERRQELATLDQSIRLDERNLEVYAAEIQRIDETHDERNQENSEVSKQVQDQQEAIAGLGQRQQQLADESEAVTLKLAKAEEHSRYMQSEFEARQSGAGSLKEEILLSRARMRQIEDLLALLQRRIEQNERDTRNNRSERRSRQEQYEIFTAERAKFEEGIGGLRQMKMKLDNLREEVSSELEQKRDEFIDVEDNLARARTESMETQSRLESLRELDASMEGFSEGVKALADHDNGPFSPDEFLGLVSQLVEVEAGYERALAAAMGERLEWVVTRDSEASLKGLDFLHSKAKGRTGFISPDSTAPATSDAAELHPLIEKINAPSETLSVVEALLAGVYSADTLDEARKLWNSSGRRYSFVTREGEMLDASGAIVGGSGEMRSEMPLRRKREMRELEVRSKESRQKTELLAVERQERLDEIRRLEERMEMTRSDTHRREIEIIEQERELHRIAMEQAREKERLTALDEELIRLQDGMGKLMEEKRNLEKERQELDEKSESNQRRLMEIQESLQDSAHKRDMAAQELTAVKVEAARVREQRNHLQSSLEQARLRLEELERHRERLRFEQERALRRRTELKEDIERTKRELDVRLESRQRLSEKLDIEKRDLDEEMRIIQNRQEEIKLARRELEEIRAELARLSRIETELDMTRRHLLESVYQSYGITLDTEHAEYLRETAPGDEERRHMQQINEKLEGMGDVNLGAIQEYEQLSERHEFLLNQQEDLVKSMDDLNKAIRKINKVLRQRFEETFNTINEKFSLLFTEMFGGGQARLELTDPENLLESGVEIIVQPPGKKLQNANLLSGGEKALSAISLLFAIFLYKPTPLCLLDEVDAPLDDANVGRFSETLKRISRKSQFILITHNKKTMEVMDALYGVTMEEPGVSKLVSVNMS